MLFRSAIPLTSPKNIWPSWSLQTQDPLGATEAIK